MFSKLQIAVEELFGKLVLQKGETNYTLQKLNKKESHSFISKRLNSEVFLKHTLLKRHLVEMRIMYATL